MKLTLLWSTEKIFDLDFNSTLEIYAQIMVALIVKFDYIFTIYFD
jgi:hypothetical protein